MPDRDSEGKFLEGNSIGQLTAGVPRPRARGSVRAAATKIGELSADVIDILEVATTKEAIEDALVGKSMYVQYIVNAIIKRAEAGDLSALEVVNNRVAGKPKEHVVSENLLVDEEGENVVFNLRIEDASEDSNSIQPLTKPAQIF